MTVVKLAFVQVTPTFSDLSPGDPGAVSRSPCIIKATVSSDEYVLTGVIKLSMPLSNVVHSLSGLRSVVALVAVPHAGCGRSEVGYLAL